VFDLFVDEVGKFLRNPMGTDKDGCSVKSGGGKLQMNRNDMFENGSDDKANGYHWKSASGWSPLKIMLTGDDAASSWSVEWNMDNRADCPILLETSIIEVSCSVLMKLFSQPYGRGNNNWGGVRTTHTVAGRFLPTIE
jgi:hypothetical protein